MNALRQTGRKPVATRPPIPSVDYYDEISGEAFAKLREAVAELNAPARKRCLVEGLNLSDE